MSHVENAPARHAPAPMNFRVILGRDPSRVAESTKSLSNDRIVANTEVWRLGQRAGPRN
jgi:hypothetical protein